MPPNLLLRLQADHRLVQLVRDGHDQAFEAVVDRYRDELLRYATRIVGDARAEDVVQQALLNALSAMRKGSQQIQLRPWLYRIVHNGALNTLRSARCLAPLEDEVAEARGLEEDVEARRRLTAALAAIAELPQPQRDALTLRAIEGRSHAEIAEALGVTQGAARQHLHRARMTLRSAVTAITPYGLLARFATTGAGDGAAGSVGPALAGAGAGAKLGAGVLAAGALLGGATQLPPLHHTRVAPPARVAGPAMVGAAPAGAGRSAGGADEISVPAGGTGATTDDRGGRRSGRRHGGRRRGGPGERAEAQREGRGDNSGPGESLAQVEQRGSRHGGSGSGEGDDGARSGSGDDGSGSGSGGHGSGDRSGPAGSSGPGDDGATGGESSGGGGGSGDSGGGGSGGGSDDSASEVSTTSVSGRDSGSGGDDGVTSATSGSGSGPGGDDGISGRDGRDD